MHKTGGKVWFRSTPRRTGFTDPLLKPSAFPSHETICEMARITRRLADGFHSGVLRLHNATPLRFVLTCPDPCNRLVRLDPGSWMPMAPVSRTLAEFQTSCPVSGPINSFPDSVFKELFNPKSKEKPRQAVASGVRPLSVILGSI